MSACGRLLAALVAALLVPSCASSPPATSLAVERRVIPVIGVAGCNAQAELFKASGEDADFLVVFAHGLLRSREQHTDQASAWASRGISILLVDQCDEGWDAEGIDRYARALNAAARASGATRIVYAGYSAGGAVSRRALERDPSAVGWLGLDPVGRSAAPSALPQRALFAPPQACNAMQAGLSLLSGKGPLLALQVKSATHCHFESPTSRFCSFLCEGAAGDVDSAAIRGQVTGLATDYLLALKTGRAANDEQWRAGATLQLLPARETANRN